MNTPDEEEINVCNPQSCDTPGRRRQHTADSDKRLPGGRTHVGTLRRASQRSPTRPDLPISPSGRRTCRDQAPVTTPSDEQSGRRTPTAPTPTHWTAWPNHMWPCCTKPGTAKPFGWDYPWADTWSPICTGSTPKRWQAWRYHDTMASSDGVGGRARAWETSNACESTNGVQPVMHFAQAGPGDSTVKRSQAFIDQMTSWIHDQTYFT